MTLKGRYYRLYPPEQPLGSTEEELSLERENTAFLLVDVQGKGLEQDFHSEHVPQTLRASEVASRESLIVNIAAARKAAKDFGMPIIYVTNFLSPATTENSEFRRKALRVRNHDILKSFQESSGRFRFSKLIAPEDGDYQLRKQYFSGFFDTPLESLLKQLGTRNLVAVG
jgi:ureidoacrylate peracid hydrolase